MATNSKAVSVSTTAVRLFTPSDFTGTSSKLSVQNNGAGDVFLGSATVTTANGWKLAAGASRDFDPSVAVWAIAAAAQDVRVLVF